MASADWRDLRDHLKKNRKNATFDELKTLLEAAGFKMHPRNKGSHRAFTKSGCFWSPLVPEGRGPVLVAYVQKVLKALEECCDE